MAVHALPLSGAWQAHAVTRPSQAIRQRCPPVSMRWVQGMAMIHVIGESASRSLRPRNLDLASEGPCTSITGWPLSYRAQRGQRRPKGDGHRLFHLRWVAEGQWPSFRRADVGGGVRLPEIFGMLKVYGSNLPVAG